VDARILLREDGDAFDAALPRLFDPALRFIFGQRNVREVVDAVADRLYGANAEVRDSLRGCIRLHDLARFRDAADDRVDVLAVDEPLDRGARLARRHTAVGDHELVAFARRSIALRHFHGAHERAAEGRRGTVRRNDHADANHIVVANTLAHNSKRAAADDENDRDDREQQALRRAYEPITPEHREEA